MKDVLNFIKNKTALLLAIVLAAVVGGATTALVAAAIPDSSGVIHGCIRANNSNLRIIDTEIGETCTGAQTPISWDQSGIKAYGHIFEGGSLDSTRSKNMSILSSFPGSIDGSVIYCLDLTTPVSVINLTAGDDNGGPNAVGSVDPNYFNRIDTEGGCPSNTEAVIQVDFDRGVYVSFN